MRRTILLILFISTGLLAYAQTAEQPQGSGTENDPYKISSLEHLYWISINPDQWDKHYLQVSYIDASATAEWFEGEGWPPINYFTGHYDGAGHIIRGIYINQPQTNHIGFFANTNNAEIKNVNLMDIYVEGNLFTGGLAGHVKYSKFINCFTSGYVYGRENVGGLLGWSRFKDNYVLSCSSSSSVWAQGDNAGGLIGQAAWCEIHDSYSTGNVRAAVNAGGLVGLLNRSIIHRSYSTGNVEISRWGNAAGGLVGESVLSEIFNSYAKGDVEGWKKLGGLVGDNIFSSVNYSFSYGHVSGAVYCGGLIGASDNNTGSSSYWNIKASGQTSSAGGNGRSSYQMTYPYADNTYENWNFHKIWKADVSYHINSGYPYLYWQEPVSVYRFFNTVSGGQLYTGSKAERDYIIENMPEWIFEGPKYYVHAKYAPESSPVYRFFNTVSGIHYYTIDEQERENMMHSAGWLYEGVKFFVHEEMMPGTIPLYRFYCDFIQGHVFTVCIFERDKLMECPECIFEGIAFYVFPLQRRMY